jgi:hypothetical protein
MPRARDYMPAVRQRAKWQPSDVIGNGGESMFGKTYYVMASDDAQFGRFKADYNTIYADGNEAVQTSLTTTLALLNPYDTVYLAPGNWTGNYTTQANADASFCSLIGIDPTGRGFGPWMGATTSTSPIIDVLARGWRISGIEFDCPSSSSAIRLSKSADGSTNRPDFVRIEDCFFTGGQTAIEFNGGATYPLIRGNHFSLVNTAGGGCINVTSTSFHLPQKGLFENNIFENCTNHIVGTTQGVQGYAGCTIKGNVFQADGVTTNASVFLDLRHGSGGGNMVVGNYFDMAAADFADTGVATVRANATDFGAGNHFQDGPQSEALSA